MKMQDALKIIRGLARTSAASSKGKYYSVYAVGSDFKPVDGYTVFNQLT
jgi:hypothetical protein